MAITQHIDLNLIPNSAPVIVHVDQYDHGTGRIIASLYEDSTPYTPTSASVYVQGTKPDGTFFVSSDGVTLEGNVVTADLTKVMTQVAGQVRIQFVVTEQTGRTGTFVFWLDVQASALPDNSQMSESDISMVEEAIETMQEYVSDSAESAQEAAASATAATQRSEDAEAWAKGTRDGEPVSPGDPTYENSSKYWAEQARSIVDIHPMTASIMGIGQPDGYSTEATSPGHFSAIGTTIVGTVNPAGTEHAADWLLDSNGNVITPDARRQYRVTISNKAALWYWTGTAYEKLSGGGEGGGHTIQDASGTDLTDRDVLQFKGGLNAEDDSTNQKTVVTDTYEEIPWSTWKDYTAEQKAAHPNAVITGVPDVSINDKADKTDLTSIIATGSTNATGSTIASGKYFYLNGTLVKAKADIANGATFTLNTNFEVATVGNALRALDATVWDIEYSATANMTYSQVIAWLESNVDKTKLTFNSKIDINGNIYTMSGVASTYFQMSTVGTIPSGVYFLCVRVGSSNQRAFQTEATTSGTTTTDQSSITAVITGGKIKVKY